MIRNRIFNLLDSDADTIRAALAGGDTVVSADKKLAALTVGVGQLAAFIHDGGWSRAHLRRVFGFCFGWLQSLGEKDVLAGISRERDRQEKLFRINKKIHINVASPLPDAARKLRVIVEELSEVAEAIDQLEIAESRRSLALNNYRLELIAEITQVAAVAVAWLESFETKNNFQPQPKTKGKI